MVRSYRGQEVDLNRIAAEQGKTMSLGNTNLNGQGDIVKHGKVVKSRAERLEEWMKSHKETTSVNFAEDNFSKKVEENIVKKNAFEEEKRVAKPKKEPVKREEINLEQPKVEE